MDINVSSFKAELEKIAVGKGGYAKTVMRRLGIYKTKKEVREDKKKPTRKAKRLVGKAAATPGLKRVIKRKINILKKRTSK